MKYTKKMILVDFDKNPNLKPADGDVFELTSALKTARQTEVPQITVIPNELADFDNAISSVLKKSELPDGDKIKYYNDLLRRYRLTKDNVVKDRESQNEALLRKFMNSRKRHASPAHETGPPQPSPTQPAQPRPPSRKKPRKGGVAQPSATAGSSDSSWSTDALRRSIKKKLIIQPLIKQIFPSHVFTDDEAEDDDDTEVDSGGGRYRTPRQSDVEVADNDDDDYDAPSLFGVPRRIRGNGRISSWEVLK